MEDNKAKICPFCGTENEDVKFCKKCGGPLSGETEELEELNYSTSVESPKMVGENTAKALSIIGWIVIIGGILLGTILGGVNAGYSQTFNIVLALPIWVGSFVSGILFVALGDIIKLLGIIARK